MPSPKSTYKKPPPVASVESQAPASGDREPVVIVAAGMKKVGKTYTTRNRDVKPYIAGNPKMNRTGRPVLVFDTNNEYTDVQSIMWDISLKKGTKANAPFDVPKITKHVKEWSTKCAKGEISPSMRRVLPVKPNGEPMDMKEKQKTALLLLEAMRGGMLILEDINSYIGDHVGMEFVSKITTNRHRAQDIIIHMQSSSAIPPRLWQNMSFLRLHHTTENILRHEKKLPNPELMRIAQLIVERQVIKMGLRRFYLYVDIEENQIIGATPEQFFTGCRDYLEETPSTMQQYLRKVNARSGYGGESEGNSKSMDSDKVRAIKLFIREHRYYFREPKGG